MIDTRYTLARSQIEKWWSAKSPGDNWTFLGPF